MREHHVGGAPAIGAIAEAGTPEDSPWETPLAGATLLLSLACLAAATFRMLRWSPEALPGWGDSFVVRWGPAFLAGVAVLSGLRWCALFAFSVTERRRHRRSGWRLDQWPRVSIFVPCFNESATIEPALDSLLELDYPAYEIVVVDDGSTDDTLEKARRYEGRFGGCTVRVLAKPNGGKWSAHNLAFRNSRGELILCVDADSRLDPPALKHMVARMADPRIDGVAGQMRVRNRVNPITRLQALEYLMGNGAGRMSQGLFGTVLVVPGPIGLFRGSAMERVWSRFGEPCDEGRPGRFAGPFEGNTFAEDFDLSLAILALGGRIAYEPRAVSRTKAPDTHFGLLNQRYRWIRGSIQVLDKLRRRTADDPHVLRPRLAAWVLSTYVPELLILPAIYLFGMGVFLALLAGTSAVLPLLAWSAAFLLLQLSAGAYFVAVHRDDYGLLAMLPLYGLYNGFVLNSAWAISIVDEIRGTRMHW